MVRWFRKRNGGQGLTAICPQRRGVACASVRRSTAEQPVLAWADFIADAGEGVARNTNLKRLGTTRALTGARCTSLARAGDYQLVLIERPDVPESELRQAARFRVKDLVDFGADEAIVDLFEVPTRKAGQENLLYAVAARRAVLQNLVGTLAASGAALESIDTEFALRNLTALLPEDVGGVAFIHLDESSGLMTLTRQGTLYLSRRFEYGRARLLEGGTRSLTPQVEGLLDAIVIEVQRSLDFYESRFGLPPIQGLVLAPLGVEFDGVKQYLASQLGLPARMLKLSEVLDAEQPLTAELEVECLLAIGAALRNGRHAA